MVGARACPVDAVGVRDRTRHRLTRRPKAAADIADLRSVITAAGAEEPIVLGFSEGGPLAMRYALQHPVRARILYGTSMRPPPPAHAAVLEDLLEHWGEGKSLDVFAPSAASDASLRETTAAMERAGASPGMIRHVMSAVGVADARAALAALNVPTLIVHRVHESIPVEEAQNLASAISGARLVVLAGIDHHPWAGDQDSVIAAFAEFLAEVAPSSPRPHQSTAAERPRTGRFSLTAAEQRVAQRAAAGASNPEIARELHIARTTVETHLKRAYAKLGIDGRRQLAAQRELLGYDD